ncbi:hypothetical protein N5I55_28280 [Klebsiella pneumoniae]|nr:hypothetical protein [Klebsiella pneumoniae]
MDVNKSIYLEGKSPQPHRWEPPRAGLRNTITRYGNADADLAAGAGHGGWTAQIHAFVEALKASPDANRHLRRAGLERDHASAGTIDC